MKLSFFKAADQGMAPVCAGEAMDEFIRDHQPSPRDTRLFLLKLADEAGPRGIDINSIGSYRAHDTWASLISQGCGKEKIIEGRRAFVANKPNPVVRALLPALSAGLVRPRPFEVM